MTTIFELPSDQTGEIDEPYGHGEGFEYLPQDDDTALKTLRWANEALTRHLLQVGEPTEEDLAIRRRLEVKRELARQDSWFHDRG